MSSRYGDDPFAIRDPEETVSRLERFLTTHLEEAGARPKRLPGLSPQPLGQIAHSVERKG